MVFRYFLLLCLLCTGCKSRPQVQEHRTDCCCGKMEPPQKP